MVSSQSRVKKEFISDELKRIMSALARERELDPCMGKNAEIKNIKGGKMQNLSIYMVKSSCSVSVHRMNE